MRGSIVALVLVAFVSLAHAQTYYFDASTYSVNENTGILTVCIRREGSVSATADIDVQITGGTALENTDFSSFGTFFFQSGSTIACRQISITNDNNNEGGSETFTVGISTNVDIRSPSSTVVTIHDDDGDDDDATETYYWEDDDYEVAESTQSVSVCMRRTGATPSRTIQVSYSGTANSNDYTLVSSWSFSTGSTRTCRSISITNDGNYENDETINMDITNTNNPTIGIGSPSRTTITIDDNDDDVTYYWGQSSYTVAESAGSVNICMRRSTTADATQTVQVSYSSGSAISGSDFNAGNTYFYFDANTYEKCNSVSINNDDDDENTETFTVQIVSTGNVGNNNIGSPSVTTVSITDNDEDDDEYIQWTSPSYTFSESSGTVAVTVTKSGGTSRSVTATVSAASGSATAGQDFNLVSTFVSIPSGSSSATVTLTIINDSLDESSESFTLLLSGATNGVGISQSTAVVTITDNDAPAAPQPDDDDGLSGGAIAGIVIGAVVGLILILGLIFCAVYFLMPGGTMGSGSGTGTGLLDRLFGPTKPAQPQVVYPGYGGGNPNYVTY